MDIIGLDFETYYDVDYSLSKMTTAQYILDPRFKVHMVGVSVNGGPTAIYESPLECPQIRKDNKFMLIAHNAMFDGTILAWKYGILPHLFMDTRGLANWVLGPRVHSSSLANLIKFYGLPEKQSNKLSQVKGVQELSDEQFESLASYCIGDVDNMMAVWQRLEKNNPPTRTVRKLIDWTIRAFVQPTLRIDVDLLTEGKSKLLVDRQHTLLNTIAQLPPSAMVTDVPRLEKALASNPQFAHLLNLCGITPPMKISPTTGKETFAFAKSDDGFKELANAPGISATLCEARQLVKSTQLPTRMQRFMDVAAATNNLFPIPLVFSGAKPTSRWSGTDKLNAQNMAKGTELARSLLAPPGHKAIVADLSNIEARVLDTLAGQTNMIQAYQNYDAGTGPDIYCVVAEALVGQKVTKEDEAFRQLGKVNKLACGFGMGGEKYLDTAKGWGITLEPEEAKNHVRIYRDTHPAVTQLWRDTDNALHAMAEGMTPPPLGVGGLAVPGFFDNCPGLRLPNGFVIKYPNLRSEIDPETNRRQLKYADNTYIYGGKAVENMCQGLAAVIIGQQLVRILDRKVWIAHMVHDELIAVTKDDLVERAKRVMAEEMRRPLDWWPELPINCDEPKAAENYGAAK